MANDSLEAAKKAKNDEFYTLMPNIEHELQFYKEYFVGKTVYCNCDNPLYSNFWKYFHLHFSELGLRKLIATYKVASGYSVKWVYAGGHDNDYTVGIRIVLSGTGDFRSEECVGILMESDVVVTNPPFSLFREYVAQLMHYKKLFLIIGSKNAVTYKEIFSWIRNNQIWTGCTSVKEFYQADGSVRKFGNIGWYTNLDNPKRHTTLYLSKRYLDGTYQHYDNYDAINVDRLSDIPVDYDGLMGVPITFLDHYNPEEFEILGITRGAAGDYAEWADEKAYPTKKYVNCMQIRKDGTFEKNGMPNTRATIVVSVPPVCRDYYLADNADGPMIICYARVLIRRK